jgi:hypothetical protein
MQIAAMLFALIVGFFFGRIVGFSAARRQLSELLKMRPCERIPEDGFYFIRYRPSISDSTPQFVRHYMKGDIIGGEVAVSGPIPEPGDIKI